MTEKWEIDSLGRDPWPICEHIVLMLSNGLAYRKDTDLCGHWGTFALSPTHTFVVPKTKTSFSQLPKSAFSLLRRKWVDDAN